MTSWQGQRIDTTSTHGTGCTLASAHRLVPRRRARRCPRRSARAREFVRVALHEAPGLGQGAGRSGRAVRLDVGAGPAAQPGDRDRQDYAQDRSISTARSASSRSSTAPRMTMRGSRPRAARPCRSSAIPRRRSARPPPSISNATISTSGSSGWRAPASRSSTARATSRGCGARRGCATRRATSSSSTAPAKRGASRRGGSKANCHPAKVRSPAFC